MADLYHTSRVGECDACGCREPGNVRTQSIATGRSRRRPDQLELLNRCSGSAGTHFPKCRRYTIATEGPNGHVGNAAVATKPLVGLLDGRKPGAFVDEG